MGWIISFYVIPLIFFVAAALVLLTDKAANEIFSSQEVKDSYVDTFGKEPTLENMRRSSVNSLTVLGTIPVVNLVFMVVCIAYVVFDEKVKV